MTNQLPPGVIEVEHCEILDEPRYRVTDWTGATVMRTDSLTTASLVASQYQDAPPADMDAARAQDEERNREGHYAFKCRSTT